MVLNHIMVSSTHGSFEIKYGCLKIVCQTYFLFVSLTDGLDFYYQTESGARKMVDFLGQMLPCRYQHSKKLISHDTHNNTYNYKFTFSVEMVPICKDSIVCLPTKLAHQLGGIGQICIVNRVTNAVHLIDPTTAQVAELSASNFWRQQFGTICSCRNLIEFVVMEVEPIIKRTKFSGQGTISDKVVILHNKSNTK